MAKNYNRKAEKAAAKAVSKIPFVTRLIIFLVIAAGLAISLFWQNEISAALGLKRVDESEYGGMKTETVLTGSGGDLNLHFVDVGQGDACVVELPDGRNMLIDSGEKDSKDKLIHYIDENVKDDDGKTITHFDIAVITHSDSDHCGEMKDVLSRFPVTGVFYRPNQEATKIADPGKAELYGNYNGKNTATYADAITAGYAGGAKGVVTNALNDEINVIKPDGLNDGDEGYYEINFYAPVKDSYSDYNNYSPVIILEYGDNRVALSGDAEKEAEADFVAKAEQKEGRYAIFDDTFTVQAIKLGHHGSRTSSSEKYLKTMTTQESRKDVRIIISCGLDNKYGHPHKEVLERLDALGFKQENILRTDVNGDIAMSIKFDETSGEYALFFGADVVRTQKTVSLGVIDITWLEIVVTFIVIAGVVLLVLPIFMGGKRSGAKK